MGYKVTTTITGRKHYRTFENAYNLDENTGGRRQHYIIMTRTLIGRDSFDDLGRGRGKRSS